MDKARDFSKTTRDGLQRKGLTVISTQAVPADEYDRFFTARAYLISNGQLLRYADVEALARS